MTENNNELIKSTILTIVQYVTLTAIMYRSTWISTNIPLMITQIIGFIVAAWAILEMNKSKLNIAPTPRKNSSLITSGPYKLVRHPMYLSLILTLTPAMISYYNQTTIIIFAIFSVNLIFKMLFEEGLLKNFFGNDYKEYMKHSWRLFPFVF